MSKQSIDNVTLKIKRKRAFVWPFATRRSVCEHVVKLLVEDDLVRDLFLLCLRHNSQEITGLNQSPYGYVRVAGYNK